MLHILKAVFIDRAISAPLSSALLLLTYPQQGFIFCALSFSLKSFITATTLK